MDHSVHGGFDHQLFEDVKKGQFFDCTVEVSYSLSATVMQQI